MYIYIINQNTMKKAGIFALSLPDWTKSAIMAAIGSVAGFAWHLINDWANNIPVHFDKAMLIVMLKGAAAAAAPYIAKNFLTNNKDQFLKSDKPTGNVEPVNNK